MKKAIQDRKKDHKATAQEPEGESQTPVCI
jgi:hypothetical protein